MKKSLILQTIYNKCIAYYDNLHRFTVFTVTREMVYAMDRNSYDGRACLMLVAR